MEAYYQESPTVGEQIRWSRAQSHPKAPQRSSRHACERSIRPRASPGRRLRSDQRKPSVRYMGSEQANDGPSSPTPGADPPTAPPDPKVMELEEDPATESDPPDDWRTLYLDYLLHDILPVDKMEARRLTRRAKSFILVEGELYKQSHIGILQLCIPGE